MQIEVNLEINFRRSMDRGKLFASKTSSYFVGMGIGLESNLAETGVKFALEYSR